MSISETDRALESVGVTATEEAVYRQMLGEPDLSVTDLARSVGLSGADAREALSSLEASGLVTRSAGKPAKFLPVSPEIALEALVAGRQSQLDGVRIVAQQWAQAYRHLPERRSAGELLEVLDSPEAVGRRAIQLVRMARKEYLNFDKPPYTTLVEDSDPVMEHALERGVRLRIVYDRESLLQPGGLEHIREWRAMGEESRVTSQVPFKLNIVDRKIALIPLLLEESGLVGGALVVHSSHLVDALILVFEMFWDRAFPISAKGPITVPGTDEPRGPDEQDGAVLDLLLAGATSGAIARRLDVGTATVERRIRRLMNELGAETRFQAGFRVAQRMGDGD